MQKEQIDNFMNQTKSSGDAQSQIQKLKNSCEAKDIMIKNLKEEAKEKNQKISTLEKDFEGIQTKFESSQKCNKSLMVEINSNKAQ